MGERERALKKCFIKLITNNVLSKSIRYFSQNKSFKPLIENVLNMAGVPQLADKTLKGKPNKPWTMTLNIFYKNEE